MENGDGTKKLGCDGGTQRVSITMELVTQKIAVDLDTLNLDVALTMLEAAFRDLEARWRFTRAQQLLQEQVESQRIADLVRDVKSGRKLGA